MKRSEGDATTKEPEVNQDHLKIVQFYREKMNSQPLHSALRSFNVQDGARTSGVYEIYRNNEVSMRGVLPLVILSDPMQYYEGVWAYYRDVSMVAGQRRSVVEGNHYGAWRRTTATTTLGNNALIG